METQSQRERERGGRWRGESGTDRQTEGDSQADRQTEREREQFASSSCANNLIGDVSSTSCQQ